MAYCCSNLSFSLYLPHWSLCILIGYHHRAFFSVRFRLCVLCSPSILFSKYSSTNYSSITHFHSSPIPLYFAVLHFSSPSSEIISVKFPRPRLEQFSAHRSSRRTGWKPEVLASAKIAVAVMTAHAYFQPVFHGVYLNRRVTFPDIVRRAVVVCKFYFSFPYFCEFRCMSINEVPETLANVSTCSFYCGTLMTWILMARTVPGLHSSIHPC